MNKNKMKTTRAKRQEMYEYQKIIFMEGFMIAGEEATRDYLNQIYQSRSPLGILLDGILMNKRSAAYHGALWASEEFNPAELRSREVIAQ